MRIVRKIFRDELRIQTCIAHPEDVVRDDYELFIAVYKGEDNLEIKQISNHLSDMVYVGKICLDGK